MRQNGLRASSFVAVADVDPRIADQLLDLLAFAHVAAYAEPVPGRVGVYRDHHVPTRPIDRLWVDREATGLAREVLDRSLAHLHAELETAIAEGVLSVPGEDPGPAALPGAGEPVVASAPDEPAAAGGSGSDLPGDPSAPGVPDEPDPGTPASGTPAPGTPAPGTSAPETSAPGSPNATGSGVVDGGPGRTGGESSGRSPARPSEPDGDDLDQAAVDARWRDIVARWESLPAQGSGPVADSPTGPRGRAGAPPPDPSASGVAWPGAAPPAPTPGDRRRTDRGPVDPSLRRVTRADGPPPELPGPRDHTPEPEDDHFSPPVPIAHPPLEKATRLGWAGLVVGLVVLVAVVAVGSDLLPRWVPLLGVALLVGGFAALVSRLHHSPPDEDDRDPDDGAVV